MTGCTRMYHKTTQNTNMLSKGRHQVALLATGKDRHTLLIGAQVVRLVLGWSGACCYSDCKHNGVESEGTSCECAPWGRSSGATEQVYLLCGAGHLAGWLAGWMGAASVHTHNQHRRQ